MRVKILLAVGFIIFLTIQGAKFVKKEKVLFISTISDPKTFNEKIAKETSSTYPLGFLFEGLTRTDGVTQEVKPCLAKSWEIKKKGLVYIFHLRDDVYWFDGKKFTADDVVFTFNDIIYNEDIPTSSRDIFTIEGKKIKVEKLGTYTVKFSLPKPFAPFLRAMAESILPKHYLEEAVKKGKFNQTWGVDTPPEKIIGTGPFKMIEYKPAERIVFVKNEKYYKAKLPRLDKIVMYIVENQDVEVVMFERGELDVLSVRGKDYARLKLKEKEGNYKIHICGPAFGTNFIAFNQNPNYKDKIKLSWFRDLNFKRAVAHCIDKQTIINNVFHGLAYPQHAAMEKAAKFFHNPNVKKYEYNPNLAKKILEKAGYKMDKDGILRDKQGNKIKFNLITNAENTLRIDIGSIISKDLQKIGMDVRFTPIDFNNLVQRLDVTWDWDAVLIGLTGGIEPHFGKNVWESCGHLHFWNPKPPIKKKQELKVWQTNLSSWEKEVDEIFNKAVSELDKYKRRKLYYRWQELVAENLPLIYTVNSAAIYAIRNTLKNTKPTAYGGALHNIEEIDKIP
jgi:peptide/nickel transport system substrate-binding protein